MTAIEDPSFRLPPSDDKATGADTYRPLGQIMRDIKKVDEEIANGKRKRADLVRELRSVAEAATSYAENTEGQSK